MRGLFGKPTEMQVCSFCESEKTLCGTWGKGLLRRTPSSSPLPLRGLDALRTTRLRSRDPVDAASDCDSSLGVAGECGGVLDASLTVICRTRDTDTVASLAISRAMDADRGVVVKTTKKEIWDFRENVKSVGRVI